VCVCERERHERILGLLSCGVWEREREREREA
jgi:hypothetical protein